MKILVIGNIGFDLMAPYLRSRGATSLLVTTTEEPLNAHWADTCFSFSSPSDPWPLVDAALSEQVDAVISISGPDVANVRDAQVREALRPHGIRVVANPLSAALIAADKFKTKAFLSDRGFPILAGEVARNQAEAYLISRRLGFPLAIKAMAESGGLGFCPVMERPQLDQVLELTDFPVLIEEYVEGWEFSVEVLNWQGRAVALYPVYKGGTHSGLHPMERVKIAPAPLHQQKIRSLQELAVEVIRDLGAEPTADVDIVWTESGPKIFEINPRFGGVTALSMAASGITSYHALVDMALDQWDPDTYRISPHFALDLPVASDLEEATLQKLLTAHGVFRVKKQRLKASTGRVAVKADTSTEALEVARKVAHTCDLAQDIGEIERLVEELLPL